MKLSKIFIIAILALFIAIPVFAGGNSEKNTEGKTVVTFWRHYAPAFSKGYDKLAQEYMEENPDIVIKFEDFDWDTYVQTLQTAFPSGTEADIMSVFGPWVSTYASNLATVPENIVTVDEAKKTFVASTIDGYIIDNKLYGIPLETNIEYGAVLLNSAMADQAGVSYKDGWTDWDNFINEMKGLSQFDGDVMTRAAYDFTTADGISFAFLSFIKQQGGSFFDESTSKFSFETEEARKALLLMKRFVDEGLVDPLLYNDKENWNGDAFFTELCASASIGPWVIGDFKPDFPEIADAAKYIPLPSLGADPVFAAVSGWGLVVSKKSEVSDIAWDIVNYFSVNKERALQWNVDSATLPALKVNLSGASADTIISAHPFLEAFFPLLTYGEFIGHMPDADALIYDILYNSILQYLQGNTSLSDTLSEIQGAAQGTFN